MSQINKPDFSSGSLGVKAFMQHCGVRVYFGSRALCQNFWSQKRFKPVDVPLRKKFRSDDEMRLFVRSNSAAFIFTILRLTVENALER